MVGQRIDARKLGLKGRHPERVTGFEIHVGGVEIADLLLITALGEAPGRCRLDDLPHVLLSLVSKDPKAPVRAFIGGDLRFRQPTPVDIAEEVITRGDGGVHILEADSRPKFRRGGRGRFSATGAEQAREG